MLASSTSEVNDGSGSSSGGPARSGEAGGTTSSDRSVNYSPESSGGGACCGRSFSRLADCFGAAAWLGPGGSCVHTRQSPQTWHTGRKSMASGLLLASVGQLRVRCTRPPFADQNTLSGCITWTGGSSAGCWVSARHPNGTLLR